MPLLLGFIRYFIYFYFTIIQLKSSECLKHDKFVDVSFT